MAPVIPSSTSNTSLVPRPVFIIRNVNCLSRSCILRKLYAQKLVLPLSTSIRLFPSIRTCVLHRNARTQIVSAAGNEVAVEEADSPVVDKDSEEPVKTPAADAGPARVQPRRSGPGRKSEMPPVKNEELVPGATFTGKVRSIQPFGAFIDFGAFTDGLVHVSRLSDSFVKDVGTVVSIGQEVKVRLVEVNFETGRISLTMRDSDETSKAPSDTDRARSPRKSGQKPGQRRDDSKKASKFAKGQNLVGTVKNITRSGAFITLPEGEEGFLPSSEEPDDGLGSMMMGGGSSLEAGQEVNVRVLRITRGQLTLTMKKEEDVGSVDSSLSQGTVHAATNPFLLAFRQNKEIATFLDEREKEEVNVVPTNNGDLAEAASEDAGPQAVATEENSDVLAPEENVAAVDQITEEAVSTVEIESEGESDNAIVKEEVAIETPSVESIAAVDQVTEAAVSTVEIESEVEADNAVVKEEVVIETPSVESVAAVDQITEAAVSTVEIESEGEADNVIVKEEVVIETPSVESEISSSTSVEVENMGPDKDGSITSSSEEIPPSRENTKEENQINEAVVEVKDEVQTETPTVVENGNVVPAPEQNGSITEQSSTPVPDGKTAKVTISPALVKQLREETGAGMMDCKNALSETGGDIIKAQEFLRKKGLASADKKASRATAEGRIGSYIHDSRIGVLIEVNCETDFVSRGEIFKELVDDLAMQVAACPQVKYLVTDDVPKDIVEKEKEIEMQKEDLLSKPEQIRAKIVEGRIRKRLEELALLEQPYIKNDKVVVKDWVKQNIATIGENIKVKRFVRLNLGEGLEKKSQDFAAEVAAQTAAKAVPSPVKEAEPAAEVEAKEAVEKPPKPTISAALVKQLREETGAGMMDCKKALAETEGNLEKAQEYLRKKGLSTADKKSSRLAAEGRIGSYIHDSRIGVLIEVNCETDFVGRSEKFKELADDLAMQVVACPLVRYVSVEDIPESVVSKEKELEMQREDILSKPENIRERIVEGRVSKRLGELALLEQSFIKDDGVLVKDLVKQTVAALGENIKVRRFVRFTLGEDN